MAHLVVENSFQEPFTDEQHNAFGARLDPCLEAHGAQWVRSYLSTDRTRLICEFEAADAEMVRRSYRSAGIDFERVWTAELYTRKE